MSGYIVKVELTGFAEAGLDMVHERKMEVKDDSKDSPEQLEG